MIDSKFCNMCNQTKNRIDFSRNSKNCKLCERIKGKATRDQLRARDVSTINFPKTKTCPKCHIEKEGVRDFGVDLNAPNGLRSYCRKCHNKAVDIRKAKKPEWKFKKSQSKRIRAALAKADMSKDGETLKYLGCSAAFGKTYIESQFREGMSWGNYGSFGWHIDHIKPLSKFDLTKEEERAKAFHYTNLQPLWWWENIEKSDKWENTTSE